MAAKRRAGHAKNDSRRPLSRRRPMGRQPDRRVATMKFERLRLTGFKSFCDSAEFRIEPGLTGVVGPNGCGKSNLGEALRWGMCESSHKAMRDACMDHVSLSG